MLIRKTANNTRTQTKMLFPTPFVGVRCGKFSMFDRKNTILGSKHTCLAVRFVILVKKCQFYKIRSPSGDTRCYSSIYLFSIVAKHPSVTSWSLPTKIKYPAKKNGQLNWFYNHELGLLKKWVYIYMYEYVIFWIGYAISPFQGMTTGTTPFSWWWHLYESLGPPTRSAHIAAAEGNGPEGNWRYFGHGDFMTAKNHAWPVRSETLPMEKFVSPKCVDQERWKEHERNTTNWGVTMAN